MSLYQKIQGAFSFHFYPCLKDVVALRAEDHDTLVEVVVLHGGGGVEDGERRVHLGLEGVVGAAVVQVVAQARHQQAKDLQAGDEGYSQHSVEALYQWVQV